MCQQNTFQFLYVSAEIFSTLKHFFITFNWKSYCIVEGQSHSNFKLKWVYVPLSSSWKIEWCHTAASIFLKLNQYLAELTQEKIEYKAEISRVRSAACFFMLLTSFGNHRVNFQKYKLFSQKHFKDIFRFTSKAPG